MLWVQGIFEVPCDGNTPNYTAAQSSLVSTCALWCWTVKQEKFSMHTVTKLGYALGTNEN